MTTHRHSRGTVRALAALALAAGLFAAQQQANAQRNPSGVAAPRLFQVSPAGAKAGSTVEVIVAGLNLEDGEKLVFSNAAVKGEPVPTAKPEIDPKTKQPKAVMNAVPAGLFKFKVAVPANIPVGKLDVRLVNKYGVSNARTFVVGDLNEVMEKEPNNETEQAHKLDMNTTVNGTIANATDVDYFTFTAKKGERVVVACRATSIDSRVTPAIEIYDSKDRQVAANRNYKGEDAVVDYTAEADGEFHIRLYQFTHTMRTALVSGGMPGGSSDHFYRLTVTTAPWIDAVVPGSVEPGKTASVTVYGRNLPGGKPDPSATVDDNVLDKLTINVTAPAAGKGKLTVSGTVLPPAGWMDAFDVTVKNASGTSNAYMLGVAEAPVVGERPDNDSPETAQEVTLPCEISGVVEKRRDRDWYTFTAKKGERWNLELISNRLGAPTFLTLVIRNPATKADIYEAPRQENLNMLSRKFYGRSEDPTLAPFVAPADGKYQILVCSLGDNLFGPRHTYTLKITKDEPDFRLMAMSEVGSMPDVPNAPKGGQAAYTVLVQRDDAFNSEIELTVEGLPAGVTCPPQILGRGIRETTLAISAADGAADWAGEIKIKGTATIKGAKVVREARSAGVVWPVQPNQNLTTYSRVERSTWLSVRDKAPFTLVPTLDKAEVAPGDKAVLKVKINRGWADIKGPIQVSVMQDQQSQGRELPQGLTFNNNQPVNVNAGQAEATLAVNIPPTVPPGTYNVVLRGQTQAPYSKDPMAKQKPNTVIVMPSSAVSITVLPKTLATLAVNPPNQNVKVGTTVKVNVKLNRQFKYDGEFKVQLVLPQGVVGVSAADITIPGDKDEGELIVQVPANAAPGNRANLTVKATAMFNGKTAVVHESKISINVTK